ncbi:MAG: hypothetical protein IH623_14355 [Verrucomicrobia bacterium]|nr:hypothetical protein [Verrucomicrobiota bacterium]
MKHVTAFLFLALAASSCATAATKAVRVFILAGQSNMEGVGQIKADPKRNGGMGSLELEQSPSNQGYHWNSNAETYYLIGEAMGEAMKQMLGAR